MPFVWDFIANLLASWVAELLTPTGMSGLAIAVAVTIAWTISWHRRQRASGQLGMASWYFIVPCLVIAALAIAGASYGLGLHSAFPSPKAPAIAQPTTVTPPRKFYSQRNKDELADALTDLSAILNTNADDIVRKTQTFVATWNQQVIDVGQQRTPDIIALKGQLDALTNSTSVFSRSLFDDDGFMEKQKTYAHEMKTILQLSLDVNTNPLSILQRSVNEFRDRISTMELARKYNDQRLIAQMMGNMRPSLQNLLNSDSAFRNWLAQTRQRIDAFRNSLG